MQTYKTKQDLKPEENDYILELVENNFTLDQKIDLLISSYQRLKLDPNGFDLLINLLCKKLDLQAHFPRKGDVNERFDVLIETNDDYKIVSEVEIPSTAILDAPRNLLDDVAVLVNRRGMNIDKVVPLVICWDLPNKRTDYWNVIKDVENVIGIKIKTCSILSLAILVWTENSFNPKGNSYYLDSNTSRIDNIIDILEDAHIEVEKFAGFFYPAK